MIHNVKPSRRCRIPPGGTSRDLNPSETWGSEPPARRKVCGVELHPQRTSTRQLLKEQQTLSCEWDEFGARL